MTMDYLKDLSSNSRTSSASTPWPPPPSSQPFSAAIAPPSPNSSESSIPAATSSSTTAPSWRRRFCSETLTSASFTPNHLTTLGPSSRRTRCSCWAENTTSSRKTASEIGSFRKDLRRRRRRRRRKKVENWNLVVSMEENV